VAFRPDPAITSLIKALATKVSLDPGTTPVLGDSSKNVRLRSVGLESGAALYAANQRFTLVENVEVELSMIPFTGKGVDSTVAGLGWHPIDRAYTTVANAKRHPFEIAVMVATSFGVRNPTFDDKLAVKGYGSQWQGGTYAAAVFNLPRQWFPIPKWAYLGSTFDQRPAWQQASVGPFIATNILGSPGQEVAGGIAFGHIVFDAGLDLGVTFAPTDVAENGIKQTHRVRRFLVGVDLRF
jgi:hypothetical protein